MPIINVNTNKWKKISFNNVYTELNNLEILEAPRLNEKRAHFAGADNGSYALFAGGALAYSGSGYGKRNTVEAYNASLTKYTATNLQKAVATLSGSSVGSYALFAGGTDYTDDNGTHTVNTVNAYNTSLSKSTPTALSYARYYITGGYNGSYAIFYTGHDGTYRTNYVDAYNSSLTRLSANSQYTRISSGFGYNVSGYALFAGGDNGNNMNLVEAYNSSLTKSYPSALSASVTTPAGTYIGNYTIFAGGYASSQYSNYVDAYNSSLTKTTLDNLPYSNKNVPVGSKTSSYGIIIQNGEAILYDSSLVRSSGGSMRLDSNVSSKVGSYALFSGGKAFENPSDDDFGKVDAICEKYTYIFNITIPPFSRYKFTGDTQEKASAMNSIQETYTEVTTSSTSPISGYIKPNANNYFTGQIS